MGDLDAWRFAYDTWAIHTGKKDNFTNPRIVFSLIQGWIDMPVIYKEVFAESEWYIALNKMY